MAKTQGVWSVIGALVALGGVSGCSDPGGATWSPEPFPQSSGSSGFAGNKLF
jgi:hypothetical protein